MGLKLYRQDTDIFNYLTEETTNESKDVAQRVYFERYDNEVKELLTNANYVTLVKSNEHVPTKTMIELLCNGLIELNKKEVTVNKIKKKDLRAEPVFENDTFYIIDKKYLKRIDKESKHTPFKTYSENNTNYKEYYQKVVYKDDLNYLRAQPEQGKLVKDILNMLKANPSTRGNWGMCHVTLVPLTVIYQNEREVVNYPSKLKMLTNSIRKLMLKANVESLDLHLAEIWYKFNNMNNYLNNYDESKESLEAILTNLEEFDGRNDYISQSILYRYLISYEYNASKPNEELKAYLGRYIKDLLPMSLLAVAVNETLKEKTLVG